MKEVAHFFGKEFLREVSEEEFKAHIPELREKMSDRCVIRALHFFKEDARVEKAVSALKNNDFDTFKSVIKSSGDSGEECVLQIIDNGLIRSGNSCKVIVLDIDDNIKQQQYIEAYEVQHCSIEMDGKIAYYPFRPCSFPFRQ